MELYDALDLPMLVRQGTFFDLGSLVRHIMDDLAAETRQAVSMEFAVRPVALDAAESSGRAAARFEFHLLQVRPQA